MRAGEILAQQEQPTLALLCLGLATRVARLSVKLQRQSVIALCVVQAVEPHVEIGACQREVGEQRTACGGFDARQVFRLCQLVESRLEIARRSVYRRQHPARRDHIARSAGPLVNAQGFAQQAECARVITATRVDEAEVSQGESCVHRFVQVPVRCQCFAVAGRGSGVIRLRAREQSQVE